MLCLFVGLFLGALLRSYDPAQPNYLFSAHWTLIYHYFLHCGFVAILFYNWWAFYNLFCFYMYYIITWSILYMHAKCSPLILWFFSQAVRLPLFLIYGQLLINIWCSTNLFCSVNTTTLRAREYLKSVSISRYFYIFSIFCISY